jgi:hypothetical protein
MIFGGKKNREREARDALEQVALFLQRSNFNDFLEQQQRPSHLIWKNFLMGLARGFGAVIGATLLVALGLGVIAWVGGLPLIGDLIQSLGDSLTP